MVASCEERGCEQTSVADVLELSGVSRATFYAHFEDKLDCLAAVTREALRLGIEAIGARAAGEESAEKRARAALEASVEVIVAQPAAARMCLVEAYGIGEAGALPVLEAVEKVVKVAQETLEQLPGREGMPVELTRALIAGIHRVVYERLQGHREGELPGMVDELWEWAMSYPVPPQPLRRRRRARAAEPPTMPPFAAYEPEQRIIRGFAAAVAEKGYGDTTIADVAAAASISQGTFYEHFDSKADAMLAALDSSGAQMLAAALPLARRAKDWPAAARAAIGASCAFLAAEPDFARLRAVAVYAAGREAIALRNSGGTLMMQTVLGPAFEDTPDVPELTLEALVGAIYGAIFDRLAANGPEALPEIAPLLTYLALAPFLGGDAACAVAIGDGRSSLPVEA
jgi:AcrR family transcriptional regulator